MIKIVFSIVIELLQKEEDIESSADYVASYFFERLCKGEYEISKYAYNSLCQIRKLPFESKSIYKVNYINACKQLGDQKTVDRELKKFDVSAMQEKYIIAKHCLANNTEEIYLHLSNSYPKTFDAIQIRDWPIFINFRETDEYKKFVAEHKDDFGVQEMTIEDIEYKGKSKESLETKSQCVDEYTVKEKSFNMQ